MLRCPRPIDEVNQYLLEEWGIVGGLNLQPFYPVHAKTMLMCVTEMNSREDIDLLVEALSSMEDAR
jgi:glycine dehydrogenase subunit 1